MLPTWYSSYRSLFAMFDGDELADVLATSHLLIGKGVVTFHKCLPEMTVIPFEAMKESRWVSIWGPPLFEWK